MARSSVEKQVIVIGAGPAGLAMGALLARAGADFALLEQSASTLGGTYARLHTDLALVSPHRYLHLPLLPCPKPRSELVTAGEYGAYLNSYCEPFRSHIRFNEKASSISWNPTEKIFTVMGTSNLYRCRKVILATGLTSNPKPFPFSKERNPKVTLLNGLDFKGAHAYQGKRVAIVGSGTSATELASLLMEKSQVILITRGPLNTLPLKTLGYNSHWWLTPLEKLPRFFYRRVCSGNWRDPAIEFGVKGALASGRLIHLEGPVEFENNQVLSKKGSYPLDVVIHCTGFLFNHSLAPAELKRDEWGALKLRKNQSVSNENFFVLGAPCANHVDSKFIRGISRDAIHIAKRLGC